MRLRFFFLILIMIISIQLLLSTEIEEKNNELIKIKKQIQENKKKATESEKKKKKALNDKKQIQGKISQSKTKIVKLKVTEKTLVINLDLTKNKLNHTIDQMAETQKTGEKQLTELLFQFNQKRYFRKYNKLQPPLASIINSTSTKLLNLEDEKTSLFSKRIKTEKNVKNIRQEGMLEEKKRDKYSFLFQKLDKDINKFEKEKSLYLKKSKDLERTAKALETLVKKLQPSPKRMKEYSYKFIGGIIKWPVKGSVIRHFGVQTNDKYKIQTINNGIDIAINEGTQVLAAADGDVVYSGIFSGTGKMIIIDHKNGYHTVYSFNNSLLVNIGTQVKQGQPIALSGVSTTTEQASVHFEVRKNGKPVDPMIFLK